MIFGLEFPPIENLVEWPNWFGPKDSFYGFNKIAFISLVAIVATSVLFFLPTDSKSESFTLEWREAAGIDWGTILLFAGGMCLGELMFSTGLAHWIGSGLAALFQSHSVVGLTVLFTGVGILVSETTTNTASATMVVPIAIAL